MQRIFGALGLVSLVGLAAAATRAANVAEELPALLESGPRPVWVFFADKGDLERDPAALVAAGERLSERSLERRARARGDLPLVTAIDLPNDPDYLAGLRALGLEIRAESRWLAAASVILGADELARVAALPFVARLEPVRGAAPREPLPVLEPAAPASPRADRLEYGESLPELAQVNVPPVHDLGFHGEGVVIGMLDSGFDTSHLAFASLDLRGAWDFVNDDPVVVDEPGDPSGQDNHGTMTLSTIGGYAPGSLIGPAYAAAFYLAKTEDIGQEVPAEEDFWVEGLEWLEANGCDLVSSSLAYDDWYTFADFDGNTCTTTIAADQAAALGVAVFNSAGNYRQSTGTIAAPADGDSVIAVGAVDLSGNIAYFSSPGPTADGRIKPDVSALGVNNHVVLPGSLSEYGNASGTSFSCPLAAGVGALVLCAHPGTSPFRLREALRSTADHAGAPDNDYGWGILDALAAVQYLDVTAAPAGPVAAAPIALAPAWPNPFNPLTRLAFSVARPLAVDLEVLDVRGRCVRRLQSGVLAIGRHSATWDGRDQAGREMPSGVYLARLSGGGTSRQVKLVLVR
ncbi:MAG TPA: S8 family serine peptidase [Candidatus Krumholzibacteria bacterium]|nr:S8 family serine peptidase [Candidatus Krumholzibacteria bacterium]HPD71970.1 S8 family serine peptidase [Candidatus Krumholzibacteria bacterium]HRY41097.1 S8 family serine peptidase [Candidatus Krumholzibacteria bacterium]